MERRKPLAAKYNVSTGTISTWEYDTLNLVVEKLFSPTDGSTPVEQQEQQTLIVAMLGLQRAVTEQTRILREINDRLKRLGD